ncbi:unnamed protein product [Ectocarpus fasciculatus]
MHSKATRVGLISTSVSWICRLQPLITTQTANPTVSASITVYVTQVQRLRRFDVFNEASICDSTGITIAIHRTCKSTERVEERFFSELTGTLHSGLTRTIHVQLQTNRCTSTPKGKVQQSKI